jgi:hypothetical protein
MREELAAPQMGSGRDCPMCDPSPRFLPAPARLTALLIRCDFDAMDLQIKSVQRIEPELFRTRE